ncbi:MAG: HAMP domain-containing sensor histidine kinase [Oligoflexia bacterium]|nr:HAMP domain-containing sensor histidine kinase [Oligoflexia bacterium]
MKKNGFELDPISLFSHELKTPLSSLQLGLSLLERDFNKNKNLIPLLKEELEYLIQFVTDNLDLRVLQNKKKWLELKWQSFDSLVEKACSSLNLLAQRENINFEIKKLNSELEVFIDSSWMFRVLYNLLSNALNFSVPHSSVIIESGLDKDHVFYCLVKNTAYEPIDSKKVFDLFYTKNFKPKAKGAGLGLNLVQAIVTAHKGQIKADTKGKETVFYFTLPQSRQLKKSA